MKENLKKYGKYYLVAFIVVLLDHVLKLWVHFNMDYLEQRDLIGDWAKLHYVLNNGIAYGIEMDFPYGKLLLSIVRLIAVFAIGYMIVYLGKKGVHTGLLWTMGLILGGALGTMVDSVFYGILLDNNVAFNAPFALFHGRVIDMLYFPLINTELPSWVPFWGGEQFEFFKPIFNLADSAITLSFFILLLRQKAFFNDPTGDKEEDKEKKEGAEAGSSAATEQSTSPSENADPKRSESVQEEVKNTSTDEANSAN